MGAVWRGIAARAVDDGARTTCRARAPQPRVPRAARPDGCAARRRAGTCRREPVDDDAPSSHRTRRGDRGGARGVRAAAPARRRGRGRGRRDRAARCVARFADVAGWPVLADPLSGLRVGAARRVHLRRHRASTTSPARCAPTLVLRLGAPPTSKALAALAAHRRARPGSPTRTSGGSTRRVRPRHARVCDPGAPARRGRRCARWPVRAAIRTGVRAWCDAERRARSALDASLRRERRAVRRSRRARSGRGGSERARRWSSRRACRCATSRRSLRPARASTSRQPRRQRDRRLRVDRARRGRGPARVTGRRAGRRSLLPARCERARGRRPTRASTPSSSSSTTTAAGSSRSSRKRRRTRCPPRSSSSCSAHRTASTSPRSPRCTACPVPTSSARPELADAVSAAIAAGGVRMVRVRTDARDQRRRSTAPCGMRSPRRWTL